MTPSTDKPDADEIARVAHAIWEAEGRPDGRDHEHWMQAKQLIEEGRASTEYPAAATDDGASGADQAAPGKTGPAAAPKDHDYVRPAGRKRMDMPPSTWSKTDEEIDESFPASDPPGNY